MDTTRLILSPAQLAAQLESKPRSLEAIANETGLSAKRILRMMKSVRHTHKIHLDSDGNYSAVRK